MKRLFIIFFLIHLLTIPAFAFSSDFYLKTTTPPTHLLPSVISQTMTLGESKTFWVDILPKEAESNIFWQIRPAIATLTIKKDSCILNALEIGDAELIATAENGISCRIRIKITPNAPDIRLDIPSDTLKLGESAVIHAYPSVDGNVKWKFDGGDKAKISYGGNLCKINPKKPGLITVFASLEDTTVSKTIKILPKSHGELDLDALSTVFIIVGGILLTGVFIHEKAG